MSRRSNRVRNTKAVTAPASITIIDDDCEEDEFANHRSCWKHIAALNTRHSKRKPSEEEFEIFRSTAPCFYKECTRRERSSRRMKCKYLVSGLRKKLNSNKFIAYLEDVWRELPDEKKNSFVYIDCLWFSMYKSENLRIRSSVFESIKTKQIFSKKSHWTLLIFCNFGEDLGSDNENTCMLFLDSLKTTGSWQRLERDIRKFVFDLFKIEGRTEDQSLVDEIPLYVPDVPQQTNDVECGSFVLYYIQRFIEDAATEDFSADDGYPDFMKENWFSHEDLETFCNKLDSLGTIR